MQAINISKTGSTLGPKPTALFKSAWSTISQRRRQLSVNITQAEWSGLWSGVITGAPGLAVRGLLAGDCADASACLGTMAVEGHHCVCYQHKAA